MALTLRAVVVAANGQVCVVVRAMGLVDGLGVGCERKRSQGFCAEQKESYS